MQLRVKKNKVKNWVVHCQKHTQTGKELDVETQLYYYGARYYDPRTSVWQSPDPAMTKYLPFKNTKKRKDKLPGGGGVFNSINLNMFGYSYQNPVRYVDPDGKWPPYQHRDGIKRVLKAEKHSYSSDFVKGMLAAQSKIDERQKPSEQYLHAMSEYATPEGKLKAIRKANNHIMEKINQSLKQNLSDKEKGEAFGEAIHPLEDNTSPTHKGFQQFTSEGIFNLEFNKLSDGAKLAMAPVVLLTGPLLVFGFFSEMLVHALGEMFPSAQDKKNIDNMVRKGMRLREFAKKDPKGFEKKIEEYNKKGKFIGGD